MTYFVLGDPHGHYDKVLQLLRAAELIDANLNWQGGTAQLWATGDFFDRGPDGLGIVELWMRLQPQAAAAGGHVDAVLGNHDLLLMAAKLMPHAASTGTGGTFLAEWEHFGTESDYDDLTDDHIEWLLERPAITCLGDHLLLHADAAFYTELGDSVEDVNAMVADMLDEQEPAQWDWLLGAFSERLLFYKDPIRTQEVRLFLDMYGGTTIVHGHTPIGVMSGQPDNTIWEPFIYANELCVNVDGGLYRGGPGFLYEFAARA